jgi:uncharacterized protein (TIRG00374 family)
LTGGKDAWPSLSRLNPVIVSISICLVVLNWLFDALRMKVLVHALGGRLSLLGGMRISVLGAFVSNVTPFDSGGEPLQAYLLSDKGITVGQSSAVIAVKTILNAFARLCLGLIIPGWMAFTHSQWHLPKGMDIALTVGLSAYFAFFALSVVLMARPELVNTLMVPLLANRLARRFLKREQAERLLVAVERGVREFRDAMRVFVRHAKPALVAVVILSFAGWLTLLSIPALLLIGFGMHPSYAEVMGIAVIFYLASAYAPTPGSSGAAELGFAVLFSTIVPLRLLAMFVAVWRLLTYYLTLAIGGILVGIGVVRQRPKAQEREN